MTSELAHIVVGYPRNDFMNLLEESSARNGCDFICLPKYKSSAQDFTLFTKLSVVKGYLEANLIPFDAITLFTDAYDALLVEHSSVIIEKFFSIGADLVFGAEANFFPANGREAIKEQFDITGGKWRYLNSGGYIGYAWAIKILVDYACRRMIAKDYDKAIGPNDQPIVQDFFLLNRRSQGCRVHLDTEALIFGNLIGSIDDFTIAKSRVRHRRSGNAVSVLHDNGGKANLAALARYWSLTSGYAGAGHQHDLRLATVNGRVLGLDPQKGKLVPTTWADDSVVLFVVKGDHIGIALHSALGLLTFVPEGAVHHDASEIRSYERLDIRGSAKTCHDKLLDEYCGIDPGGSVELVPPPLSFLNHPSIDPFLNLVREYGPKL